MKQGQPVSNGVVEAPARTTVALYVRVSTEEQAVGGFSIGGQLEKLELACKLHDWLPIPAYVDDGYSGKDMDRPAMKRLMEDARKGLFGLVLVYKLDRLSRRLGDLIPFGDQLERMKIGIRSVTEPMDTSNPAGKLLFNLLGSFAQFEREMISERTRLGLNRRKKEGKWNGLPPFGYRMDKEGLLEIHPDELPFARRVFDLFLQDNLGVKAIARTLRQEDRCTRRKRKWAKNSVWNMLVNPAYAGLYRIEEKLVKAPHKGIITREEFEQVQQILEGKNPTNARNHLSPNVLNGLIRCGLCGSVMTTGKGKGHYYYHCTGRGRDNQCPMGWIPARDVETEVIRDIKAIAGEPALIDRCINERKEVRETEAKSLAAERVSLAKQLEGIERNKDKRVKWLLENLPDRAVAEEVSREVRTQIDEIEILKVRQKDIAARITAIESENFQAEVIAEYLKSFGDSVESLETGQKRILMQGLVKEVVVHSKDDCEVVLTIPLPSMPHPRQDGEKGGLPDGDRPYPMVPPAPGAGARFTFLSQMG